DSDDSEAYQNGSSGYSPPQPTVMQSLRFTGYLDVGFASVQGNGSSFAPGDFRVPADYGVDAFAPAVNSRGEVASTDSGGRFTNGFLPRSAGIGGHPSFLINTVDVDLRYTAPNAPLMFFTRLQFLPRFSPAGESTTLLVK